MENQNLKNIKQSGFKAPKGYFENLEESLLNASELNIDIKDSGFKVPENYFETLEGTIINNISNSNGAKIIPLFSKRNLIYVSSIAAAVLLIFNLSVFNSDITFDSLDNETVENYIIDEELSSYEIASLLSEEDLLDLNFTQDNFNEETIENYILNNLDIEDLIIE